MWSLIIFVTGFINQLDWKFNRKTLSTLLFQRSQHYLLINRVLVTFQNYDTYILLFFLFFLQLIEIV